MATVTVRSQDGLAQEITVGSHRLLSDEPAPEGEDQGLTPYELLLGALGSCTAMTVRMYADRKGIPLTGVEVVLGHERVYRQDCADCETKDVFLDRITKRIKLLGELTSEQRQRLASIAERCPVQRTLQHEIIIQQEVS